MTGTIRAVGNYTVLTTKGMAERCHPVSDEQSPAPGRTTWYRGSGLRLRGTGRVPLRSGRGRRVPGSTARTAGPGPGARRRARGTSSAGITVGAHAGRRGDRRGGDPEWCASGSPPRMCGSVVDQGDSRTVNGLRPGPCPGPDPRTCLPPLGRPWTCPRCPGRTAGCGARPTRRSARPSRRVRPARPWGRT